MNKSQRALFTALIIAVAVSITSWLASSSTADDATSSAASARGRTTIRWQIF